MSDTVTVAIISASAAVITAFCALASNAYWIGRTFDSLRDDIKTLRDEIRTLRDDVKTLTGLMVEFDKRLTKVEVKLGIQP